MRVPNSRIDGGISDDDSKSAAGRRAFLGLVAAGATAVGVGSAATEDSRQPKIDSVTKVPGPDETIGVHDPTEASVTARDPDGKLRAIGWVEGRNHTLVELEIVDGTEATSTLSFDEPPHWIRYGYPTLVRAVTEDGRDTGFVRKEGPAVRLPYEVDVVETNAPVEGGERLEAVVEVENVGDMQHYDPDEQEIRLLVGEDRDEVDSETVSSLGWGESTDFTLGFETYPVRRDVSFPIRAESPDFADRVEVEVRGTDEPPDEDAVTEVAITDTIDPVEGGEPMEVTADVTNRAEHGTETGVELVVGDPGDVVDEASLELAAGETRELTLGYETYPVEQDVAFDVAVRTDDASDRRTVEVLGTDPDEPEEAPLEITVTGATDPVEGGAVLEVFAQVTNRGEVAVTEEIALEVGEPGDVVDTATVEVAAGSSEQVVLAHETYPVERDVSFPTRVVGEGDADEIAVEVLGVDDTDDEPDQEGRVTVAVESTNAPVTGGEWLEVVASCGNPGPGAATDEVQ